MSVNLSTYTPALPSKLAPPVLPIISPLRRIIEKSDPVSFREPFQEPSVKVKLHSSGAAHRSTVFSNGGSGFLDGSPKHEPGDLWIMFPIFWVQFGRNSMIPFTGVVTM
jgi:hypothetical protein